MKPRHHNRVFGRHLPAPRVTLWVPLLVACVLSLPVLVATLVSIGLH